MSLLQDKIMKRGEHNWPSPNGIEAIKWMDNKSVIHLTNYFNQGYYIVNILASIHMLVTLIEKLKEWLMGKAKISIGIVNHLLDYAICQARWPFCSAKKVENCTYVSSVLSNISFCLQKVRNWFKDLHYKRKISSLFEVFQRNIEGKL